MNDRLEKIAEAVHNAWRVEKINQGENHPDMVPYAELEENVKEYDRVTVRAVMKAIQGLHQAWIPVTEQYPDEPGEGQGIKEYIVTIDGAFESTTLSYLGRDQWIDAVSYTHLDVYKRQGKSTGIDFESKR